MNGCCGYSIAIFGSLLALTIWIWCPYDTPRFKQQDIVLFFGGFIVSVATMIGLYSPLQTPVRLLGQQSPNPLLAAAPSDGRALAETLLGTAKPAGAQTPEPALAYAAPESGVPDNTARITSGPLSGLDNWSAIYDISAHTVYMPNGTMLEAHSGRGTRLDNPRYVHEPMRGATPPHVYELALREKPFHSVRALRLKPIGDTKIFGRDGFLAHSYMLGPNGDSNGCVVFKDYNAFLQAFENGEVKRLIVVTHLD